MLNIPEEIFEAYMEDEYQELIHMCQEELNKPDLNEEYHLCLLGLLKYAEASEEWEKSYNYDSIHYNFQLSVENFQKLSKKLIGEDKLLIECFIALSQINDKTVEVENMLIGNNPEKMAIIARESAEIAQEIMDLIPKELNEESPLVSMQETLIEYYHYQAGMAEYAELMQIYRQDPYQFEHEYSDRLNVLKDHVERLEEIGTDITKTEVNAFLQNVILIKQLWDEKTPNISINDSIHILSISFYVGGDFANHILNTYSKETSQIISEKLFNSSINIQSGGIDTLDDFLETTIGSEYADKLHLILDEGIIDFCDKNLPFEASFFIRRFGTATIAFNLKLEDLKLTVSDLRTIQQLVGPQAGTTRILWQEKTYPRFDNICREIEEKLLRYHDEWKKTSKTLPEFLMDKVPFEHERTWFARSILGQIYLKNRLTGDLKRIYDYDELKKSHDFKGLVIPLFEGRSALDDWIQKPIPAWQNLAEIRGHSTDLIIQTRHSLTLFMPADPNWIIDQISSCGEIVNDITTLIISFDVMAETVRSRLINEVQNAKYALEQVQMKTVTEMIDTIRKRSIEVTEFELLALQSIQLLHNQGTLKYFDHSEFMNTLISNIKIEPIINSLERKLEMVKESQKGIIRTADDLLAKYKDRVSQSQQRLVKVVTLLIAGFAQISLLGGVLTTLNDTFNLPESYNDPITIIIIVIVVLVSAAALSWLGLDYFKSRKIVFETSTKKSDK